VTEKAIRTDDELAFAISDTNRAYQHNDDNADDLLNDLRSGRDKFTNMKKPAVVEAVGVFAWMLITAKFNNQTRQLSAARWYVRGLGLDAAIRKIEVAREIGHEIAERRRQWEDDE
jgi:hypothetical protein